MRMKKVLVSLMAALMVISSVQITVFAEETAAQKEETPKANFAATIGLMNENCLEYEKLKQAELSVTMTKTADPAVTVTAPIVYDAEVGIFSASTYIEDEAMAVILEELSERQTKLLEESMEELFTDEAKDAVEASKMIRNKLSEAEEEVYNILAGYTVAVNGLPEGEHYQTDFSAMVENGDMVIFVFELSKSLIESLLSEEGKALNLEADSYIGLMDEIAKMEGFASYEAALLAEGYTEAEIAEEMELYIEMDTLLTQARNGEYPSSLSLLGVLTCECPTVELYEIYHEYYKEDANGKRTLVARVAEGEPDEYGEYYLEGESGDYIRAEDFIQCEYEGVTYEYVNSYDSFVIYDEQPNWKQDIVTEFKLGDMMYMGMVLRYVDKEEPPAEMEPVVDLDDTDVNDGADTEVSPATGDHTPIALYVAILITAIAAVIVLFAYKKKK